MYKRRSTKRGNYRSVSSLCPNCFSTLTTDEAGAITCSGDRIKSWQDEFDKFKALSEIDKKKYLAELDNPKRFLELAGTLGSQDCGFSTKISHVVPNYSVRIPDPIAVRAMERKLQRLLTEEELDEKYIFENGYKLPFTQFPEDF
jgi:hypothetical protein